VRGERATADVDERLAQLAHAEPNLAGRRDGESEQ
jgi:hypothetical protein